MPPVHADQPDRWAVVHNSDDEDSAAMARAYAQRRSVPENHLIGLPMPGAETISQSEFVDMKSALAAELTARGLEGQVIGLLLAHGVPGQYVRADGVLEPIAGQLHRIDSLTTAIVNPVAAGGGEPARPSVENLAGCRLTARLDAPSLEQALAMLDRADAVMAGELGEQEAIWLDPYGPEDQAHAAQNAAMLAWSSHLDRQLTRLPIHLPAAPATDFTRIEQDGFFWGWDQASPPAGFFGSTAGRRVFCFQATLAAATMPTLRAEDGSWASAAMQAGYAATAGGARWISASAVPSVRAFFAALRAGWTLAEAWFVACPLLRAGLTLAGDPLMRVTMPRAGWEWFGPAADVESIDWSRPTTVARQVERSIVVPGLLEGIQVAAVRHRDAGGRLELGVRAVRFERAGQAVRRAPWPICWPADPGWRPRQVDQRWRITARWAGPASGLQVAAVRLIEQIESRPEQAVAEFSPAPCDRAAEWERTPADEPVRYRVQTVSGDGVTLDGPWSAWLTRQPVGDQTLALL
jgi:uncharacterized protein (TIGR03790 family)